MTDASRATDAVAPVDMEQLAYLIGYWESVVRIDGYNVMATAQCLRELESRRQSPEPAADLWPECTWRQDSDWEMEVWHSACGEAWSFTEGGGPAEHRVAFCQGCGKPVKAIPYVPPPDEDEDEQPETKDEKL